MRAIHAALCLMVLLAMPVFAHAQAPQDLLTSEDEGVQFFVSWGFDGSMLNDRWSPVRIYIGSGANAVSGVVEITYRQDASQTMRIVLPFATTPGLFVPVEAALALPAGCQSVSIRILNERGRRLRARTFSRNASRDDEQMPQILPSSGVPLLNLGKTGLEQISPDLQGETFGTDTQTRRSSGSETWSRLTILTASPRDLPTSAMAYDALGAVVLQSSLLDSMPRASVQAIGRWVRGGGTLVLIASDPGDQWRSLLALPGAPPPIRLAALASITSHEDLEELVELSPDLSARRIRLTQAGQDAGWTRRWIENEQDSLIAEGPVGLGWALVVGADPQRIPALASDDETAYLWREILRESAERWVAELPEANAFWGVWGREPSGSTPRHRAAISSVLDHALRAPPPGVGVFILLVLCVVILAVLVGPVDAIALKLLRKRQHSWATAMVYIALASVIAGFAPVLLRSGETTHARARCVDSLPPSLGGDAHQTGLSSTFAASSGPIRFVDPAPGSWWRPVSTLQTWGNSAGAGPTLDCVQFSVASPTGLVRQNIPSETRANTQRLWTLRTTMDQQRAAPHPGAVLSPDLTSVRVTALPEGARIISGALALPAAAPPERTRWLKLTPGAPTAGVYEATIPEVPLVSDRPERWTRRDIDNDQSWRWNAVGSRYIPARLGDLPGAWERTRALDAYLASGRYALLLLELEHAAPDVGLSVSAQTNVLEVHRIIIPMPEPAP